MPARPRPPPLSWKLLPISLPLVQPWWSRSRPTVHYLMQTEAHVYALAVVASTLLAFYPFLIVMLSFCRDILHWPAAQAGLVFKVLYRVPGFALGQVSDFVFGFFCGLG